jgi:hypothetical protein
MEIPINTSPPIKVQSAATRVKRRQNTASNSVTTIGGVTAAVKAACAEKRVAQVRRVVRERLEELLWGTDGEVERVRERLAAARTPYEVAEELLANHGITARRG